MARTDPNERLIKQPTAQRTVKLSAPLDSRLDALVALLNREGSVAGRLYRHDLIAALIALAPEDVTDLERLMSDYTAMSVRDALVGEAKNAKVIDFPAARPGRRTL